MIHFKLKHLILLQLKNDLKFLFGKVRYRRNIAR